MWTLVCCKAILRSIPLYYISMGRCPIPDVRDSCLRVVRRTWCSRHRLHGRSRRSDQSLARQFHPELTSPLVGAYCRALAPADADHESACARCSVCPRTFPETHGLIDPAFRARPRPEPKAVPKCWIVVVLHSHACLPECVGTALHGVDEAILSSSPTTENVGGSPAEYSEWAV